MGPVELRRVCKKESDHQGAQTSGLTHTQSGALKAYSGVFKPEVGGSAGSTICLGIPTAWTSAHPALPAPCCLPLPGRNIQRRNQVLGAPNSKQKIPVSLSAVFLWLTNKARTRSEPNTRNRTCSGYLLEHAAALLLCSRLKWQFRLSSKIEADTVNASSTSLEWYNKNSVSWNK